MLLSFRNLLAGLALCCLAAPLHAQHDKHNPSHELHGSGRVVQEQKTLKPFHAVEIKQFPATVIVEVGGTASTADIRIDDNLRPYLLLEEEDGKLTLSLRDPEGNPSWVSKASVTVTLRTPTLTALGNSSNGDVTVNGLGGEAFALANGANGNVTLRGKVNAVALVSTANGSIHAGELVADKASVVSQANGSVRLNAKTVSLVKSGNGSVTNVGEK
jgi:hypothetical protein